jgi:hypothetical protein
VSVFKKKLGDESTGVKIFEFFWSLKGFFYKCGVLVNLKNKGVLLSGIGTGKEFFFFFFFQELFLVWRKNGGIPFFSLFLSFLIIW